MYFCDSALVKDRVFRINLPKYFSLKCVCT